jgi:hypothetical protein
MNAHLIMALRGYTQLKRSDISVQSQFKVDIACINRSGPYKGACSRIKGRVPVRGVTHPDQYTNHQKQVSSILHFLPPPKDLYLSGYF